MFYRNGKFYNDERDIADAALGIARAHGIKAQMKGSPFSDNYSDAKLILHLAGMLDESSFSSPYKFARELLVIPNNLLLFPPPEGSKDTRQVYDLVNLRRSGHSRHVSAADSSQLIELLHNGTEFQRLCASVLEEIRSIYLEHVMRNVC